jgi:transcription antitermination factor NusG
MFLSSLPAKNCPPRNWYVLYISARAEKKVYQRLLDQEIETYLPLVKSVNTWKNRQKKTVETPLFTSYIFAKGFEHELSKMARISGVVTYLRNGCKPYVITQHEIDQVKTLVNLQTELSVESELHSGDKVEITSGLLKGYEGVLQSRKGKYFFGIQLKGLNLTIFTQLTTNSLKRIN